MTRNRDGRRRTAAITDTRTRHAGWSGVSERWTWPHATRSPSFHADGLGARWRWIGRNRKLTDDMNVGSAEVFGGTRRLNRVRRLSEQSGGADQGRQNGSTATVRRLYRARRRSAARLVVHRAHGARAMAARAFRRMRVGSGDPQGDGCKRDRPGLAGQPDDRDGSEDPTQMRHQEHVISCTLRVSNGCVLAAIRRQYR